MIQKTKNLRTKEEIQDDQYFFPYHYMDIYSGFYRRIKHLDYLSLLKTIKNTLPQLNGLKTLDAGCGDGRLCHELNSDDIDIVGVDKSEKAIRFAKAFNPTLQFYTLDLTKLSFDEKFDVVTFIEVLEHIPPDIIPDIISQIWQVLKPEGKLLVSVPTTNLPVSEKHYQHFTIQEIEKLFTPKFRVIKIIGHLRTGKAWRRFLRLQRYAEIAWPLSRKVPGMKRFLQYVEDYYHTNVETSSPEQAGRLLILFQKNQETDDKSV